MPLLSNLLFTDNAKIQLIILVAIGLVVIGVLWIIYRTLFRRRLRLPGGGRARQPRLGLVDAFNLDGQRQLVLVRRDNVEHLVMIGGPTDVVIESQIVRALGQAARDRDAGAAKAPGRPEEVQPARPAANKPPIAPPHIVAKSAVSAAPTPPTPPTPPSPVRLSPNAELDERRPGQDGPQRSDPPGRQVFAPDTIPQRAPAARAPASTGAAPAPASTTGVAPPLAQPSPPLATQAHEAPTPPPPVRLAPVPFRPPSPPPVIVLAPPATVAPETSPGPELAPRRTQQAATLAVKSSEGAASAPKDGPSQEPTSKDASASKDNSALRDLPPPPPAPSRPADDPFAGLDSLEAEMARLLGRDS